MNVLMAEFRLCPNRSVEVVEELCMLSCLIKYTQKITMLFNIQCFRKLNDSVQDKVSNIENFVKLATEGKRALMEEENS